ncbi:MAG: RNA ligase family protein [Candidatus Paceibacterota bacterium]|jgi:RNA ligase (TIGR02306 family)
MLAKIKSIKKIDNNSKRYDIEVEKTHNFFANNILVHNCSTTYILKDGEFTVCSRNKWLKKPDMSTYWKIAKDFNIEDKLKKLNRNIAIQGEIYGDGIQSNRLKITGKNFAIYRIWDIDKQEYILPEERHKICNELGLEHVPVLRTNITIFNEKENMADLILHADGKSMINPKCSREGVVYKSMNGNNHFKVISNKYLIECGKK